MFTVSDNVQIGNKALNVGALRVFGFEGGVVVDVVGVYDGFGIVGVGIL